MPSTMEMNINSASLLITAILLIAEVFFYFAAIRRRRISNDKPETDRDYIHGAISDLSGMLSAPITLIDGHCQMLHDNDKVVCRKDNADILGIAKNISLAKTIASSIRNLCLNNVDSELTEVSNIAAIMLDAGQKKASAYGYKMEISIQPEMMWVLNKNTLEISIHLLTRILCEETMNGGDIAITLKETDGKLVLSGKNSGSTDKPKSSATRKALERIIKNNGGCIRFSPLDSRAFNCEIQFSGNASAAIYPEKTDISNLPEGQRSEDSEARNNMFDSRKKTILILNNNNEVMTFISTSLSSDYNILSSKSADDAIQATDMILPDMVICEYDGYGNNDGKRLLKHLKEGKMTMQVPVVIITTNECMDEKDLDKADLCLSAPLNIKKIKVLLKQVLKRNDVLKDYYSSPICNYSILKGKVIHLEDKKFLDRIYTIIADNISNNNLSPDFIASEMSMSIRNLYRKFGSLSSEKLAVAIKDYRLSYAASLLASSKYTVDEIIYKAGFINRGTFFKVFREKYGTTPKQYMTNNQHSSASISLTESNCA